MSRVLSAVAWPYANGPRHIGHVAGFGVPSDVFSRYMRMAGHEVLMVSGTDEHGTPILVTADKEGKTARELADDSNRVIVEDLQGLGLSYDLFTRTTTGNHYGVVQEMFTTCLRNGYMVEQTSLSAISPSTGRTLPDRYIEGTCPICKYADARGDQCDNCGNQLDPTDLLEPRSKINGETPQFVETQHWFLDLPAVADALGEWLDGREASGTWRPNVIKFSQNILEEIRPRAMTRDIDWGIPVPGWEDQPNKRLYVWFDAVIGYLSASIEWARRLGEPEKWREWWNDTDAEAFYFMGKDNIVFHSQIWPAELLAHNGQGERGGEPGAFGVLNLPTEVVSSEFLTFGDAQFSTSRGHVIYVRDMLERYGPDPLRYFICAAGPETSDAAFTWADFVTRNNSELVAGWGNLVNRTATMVAKNFGEVPAAGPLEEVDEAVLATVRGGFESVGSLIERHRLRAAIAEAMRVVGEVNKYLTVTEPYKMKDESQRERLATVLHVALQCVSDCNTLLAPFLPHAANKVHAVLGGEGEKFPMPVIEQVTELEPDNGAGLTTYPVITGDYSATPAWESRPIVVGTPIAKPTPVFTKLDPSVVEEELARVAD
ncbi:methionine--tRNA ligase [uncultured Nocardioides sp.]|jgi:methionyl-tRNA synthetase|uniref:methionine--tRNA ligase n=1 Tax=uncultured Nocardioides sp. TaxID=198441 RepID=UPI0032B218CD|nr:methionine--tRNA ligase [Nocardioides sp.]|tara:strand:+ start:491 stop:2293 length:1803 start_codon:yes stop_codon:yes gene_type:complete